MACGMMKQCRVRYPFMCEQDLSQLNQKKITDWYLADMGCHLCVYTEQISIHCVNGADNNCEGVGNILWDESYFTR